MHDSTRTISLLHLESNAVLSSHSKRLSGYPFGSLIQYDITEANEFIFFISTISEHYHNILENPRISIFVADPFGAHNPQKYGRCTVTGNAVLLTGDAQSDFATAYRERFPNAVSNELAHSFVFVKLVPDNVRWIGGFGSMGWIGADELSAYQRDPVTYAGKNILVHMNLDHANTLPELATLGQEEVKSGETIEMVFVCSDFFELQVRSENACRRLQIPFSTPCENSNAVRRAIINLLSTVRGRS